MKSTLQQLIYQVISGRHTATVRFQLKLETPRNFETPQHGTFESPCLIIYWDRDFAWTSLPAMIKQICSEASRLFTMKNILKLLKKNRIKKKKNLGC